MAHADIRPSFAGGEISPSLWGRLDFAKTKVSLSVGRNGFVSYRGGWSSRAGTAFVGQCKQPVTAAPPRLIRFQYNIFQSYILEFGDGYMRVVANGAYVTEAPLAVTGAQLGDPAQLTIPGHGYAVDDWFYLSGLAGSTQFNGRFFRVGAVLDANTITLHDLFGNPVDARLYGAYSGGGTAARIYTLAAPYAAADLPYLKFVQSADVMSLCCVNQATGAEYPPYDLTRTSATQWAFTQTSFVAAIGPPLSCSVTQTNTTTGTNVANYAYCVTAVDAATGEESIASPVAYTVNSVDIALTAGSHTVTWAPVVGAASYNIYATSGSYDQPVASGSSFGFIGTSLGVKFVNSNILPDFTKTPPTHTNPFARNTILSVNLTAGGSGYVQGTTTATVSSTTGSGAALVPVVSNGVIEAVIVQDGGQGYAATDAVVFADTGGGSGATATLTLGASSGTYPGVVAYFQQRRVYASTLASPDTLFFSQTSSYTNFDASSPPIGSDSITVTPWGQYVNGVQWLQPMPGGLIAATGQDAWQVAGTAGVGSPITPAQVSAAQQESNGFSPTVPIIKIGSSLLYLSSFGSAAYDFQYQFYANIYTGTDISVLSNHLFEDYQITHWAYAKQPFKVVWASRNDGKFLSLTYLKEQEIIAWCRHDTNGLVQDVAVASESTLDVPYFVVKRYIVGAQQWVYYLERMDDRLWDGPEDPWCVDCGLALAAAAPNATLSASSVGGSGAISGGTLALGGQGYTAPTCRIVDATGNGSGGAIGLTVMAGAITGFTILSPGQGYSAGSSTIIEDATGTGAVLNLTFKQSVTFSTDRSAFAAANVGSVLRVGGGRAAITSVVGPQQVVADVDVPILATMPNDPNGMPMPAGPGTWTMTAPVTTLTNLGHLEGMQVAVLADGAVVAGGDEPLLTVTGGTITLPAPASRVVVGLPFVAQAQSMHFEPGGAATVQGKRKKVVSAQARLEKTRGAEIGCDQPVAAALPSQQEIPWTGMQPIPDVANVGVPNAAIPLFTGDSPIISLQGGWQGADGCSPSPGMLALQQRNPMPLNLLDVVGYLEVGDSDG